MSSNEAAKVTPGGDIVVDSQTTVEIKIKTLDSQIYTLRVNKRVPVPALKEQIASITGVLSGQQRLICRGKVLKDDQLLSAYHVEDGHTLHLVVREPHLTTPHMGSEGTSSASGSAHNRGSQVSHSFVFESVNVDQGDMDTSVISRIISSMLDSIGAPSTGAGNIARDIREAISERFGRTSGDNPNPTNQQRDRRQAELIFRSAGPSGHQPTVIPDSLTTLSQYMRFMRDEFRREGFGASVGDHANNSEATGVRLNQGQSHDSQSPAAQVGLPTPASLAEILHCTRQLLMDQTGECLFQLARQLEEHTSITDQLTRMNLQASAIRSGVVMRNLGSMLLELGRTTMTLRMGQSPAEAVVNAGPANFISATGPNPLMVQAVPFGTNIASSGHGVGEPSEAPFLPRNVEIRIRTARAVPVATTNASEQPASNQQQEQAGSAANIVNQAFSGENSGVRVVPLRTVVAVPNLISGVNTSTSDSSTSSVRLIYPFLARVRQTNAGNSSDTRRSQASGQLIHQNTETAVNLESNGGVGVNSVHFSGFSPPANDSAAYQGLSTVLASSQQSPAGNNTENGTQATDNGNRGTESHDAASNDQGVFFSNALRAIIPFISQGINPSSSTAHGDSGNLNGSSSSQHQRDSPEAPSPKRMKSD